MIGLAIGTNHTPCRRKTQMYTKVIQSRRRTRSKKTGNMVGTLFEMGANLDPGPTPIQEIRTPPDFADIYASSGNRRSGNNRFVVTSVLESIFSRSYGPFTSLLYIALLRIRADINNPIRWCITD